MIFLDMIPKVQVTKEKIMVYYCSLLPNSICSDVVVTEISCSGRMYVNAINHCRFPPGELILKPLSAYQ